MNVLILADKKSGRTYQHILKSAPNTTVLGVVNLLSDKVLQNLKNRYNPHIILLDESIRVVKNTELSENIIQLQNLYPHSKIILLEDGEHKDRYDNLGLYAIISGSITNVELFSLIDNAPVSISEQEHHSTNFYNNRGSGSDEKNKIENKRKYKYHKSINKKYWIFGLFIISIILLFVVLSVGLNSDDDSVAVASSNDEVSESSISSTVTITKTEATTTTFISETISETTITTTKATERTTKATTTVENNAVKPYIPYNQQPLYPKSKPQKNIEVKVTTQPTTSYSPPPTKN